MKNDNAALCSESARLSNYNYAAHQQGKIVVGQNLTLLIQEEQIVEKCMEKLYKLNHTRKAASWDKVAKKIQVLKTAYGSDDKS